MSSPELEALTSKLEELLRACDSLQEENRALRNQQANLLGERAALIEKSELARTRVEAMIARLKAMEVGS